MGDEQKISGYAITRDKRARGVDRVDVTQDDGGGGFDSAKMSGSLLENVLAEFIGLDCQIGNEGTVSMTLVVDAAVRMHPAYISFHNTAGAKGAGDIVFRIGATSGQDNVMPITQLEGFFSDATWIVNLEGPILEMLSDSSTYFLTLDTGSSGVNICDIRVHGSQFDV